MTQSPKQRFLAEEKLAKQFLDVVDSEAFTRATELSMLQLMDESTLIEEIKGARRFLEILKSLPEKPKFAVPKPSYNLDHNLK